MALPVEFVLTGFSQENNIRRYTFQALPAGNARPSGNPTKRWTVSADLSLMRKHKIPLQELPLLCKRVVEAQGENAQPDDSLAFTERDMLGYANDRSAAELAAELKKRARRMPSSSRVGMAWRTAPHR